MSDTVGSLIEARKYSPRNPVTVLYGAYSGKAATTAYREIYEARETLGLIYRCALETGSLEWFATWFAPVEALLAACPAPVLTTDLDYPGQDRGRPRGRDACPVEAEPEPRDPEQVGALAGAAACHESAAVDGTQEPSGGSVIRQSLDWVQENWKGALVVLLIVALLWGGAVAVVRWLGVSR